MIKRTLTVTALAVSSTILAMGTASAAPAPAPAAAARSNELSDLLGPVLAALEPLAQGIDQGVPAGATDVNAAAHHAGEAMNQAAQGVGDAAQGMTQGAGETVAEAPGAVDRTIHGLETSGLAGDVVTTAFGGPSGH
jgi:hypothetical protein